jgi:hypothetical protein
VASTYNFPLTLTLSPFGGAGIKERNAFLHPRINPKARKIFTQKYRAKGGPASRKEMGRQPEDQG